MDNLSSMNKDTLEIIIRSCNKLSQSALYGTNKELQKFIKINTRGITMKNAIKNASYIWVQILQNAGYYLDMNEQFLSILETNNYDFIIKMICINSMQDKIVKNMHRILEQNNSRIILYLFKDSVGDDYYWKKLLETNRIDVILVYHTEINNPCEFGRRMVKLAHSIEIINFELLKFLFEYGLKIKKSHVFNIIRTNSLENIKWVFENITSKQSRIILPKLKELQIRFYRKDVVLWLYNNGYCTNVNIYEFAICNNCVDEINLEGVDTSITIKLLIHYARINNFMHIKNYFDHYQTYNEYVLGKIMYYAIKYKNYEIFKYPIFKKYDINDMIIISSINNDDYVGTIISDISRLNNYGKFKEVFINKFIDHISSTNNIEFIKWYNKLYEYDVCTIMKIHKQGNMEMLRELINNGKFKITKNLIAIKYLCNSNDIFLIDYLIAEFSVGSNSLNIIMEYCSFEFIKLIFEDSRTKFLFKYGPPTIRSALEYGDLRIIDFFSSKRFHFSNQCLYYAFTNNIGAAEWLLSSKHFKYDLTIEFILNMSRDWNYRYWICNINVVNKFFEWVVSKNPRVGNCNLRDIIKNKYHIFLKYMIENYNIIIESWHIDIIIKYNDDKNMLKYLKSKGLYKSSS